MEEFISIQHEELTEPESFSISWKKPAFDWFWLTRAVWAIEIKGLHWFLASFINAFGILTMLVPAVLIEIVAEGAAYLIVKFLIWLVNQIADTFTDIRKKTIKSVFVFVKVIGIIIAIILLLITLVTNTESWINAANAIFSSVLRFLHSL